MPNPLEPPSPPLQPTATPQSIDATPVPGLSGTLAQDTPSPAALACAPFHIQVAGYEILGELGRGGMGAVFKGHDLELGRDLAIKVLLEGRQSDDDTVRRFLEEAQIGGQLQHPGVVPVYEAGRLADNRPYFTMKLVEGRTLASLLESRKSPADDLPRFLKIFEQLCQTLAYAHSRGVIHRDLKPLNIMVGAFGEVQVMDWGLAKVVKSGGVHTVRSEATDSETTAGSVLGTPAYMAPEQACGDVDGLDERCDVFGLGAILCEILTGYPPYRSGQKGTLLRQAARADLADAFARLEACGADAELVGLTKSCLAAEPADRPNNGGGVAKAIADYLTGVQERLRTAEVERAAAQTRVKEEHKRWRVIVALAATVFLALAGAAAGALWFQQERADRAAEHARLAAEQDRRTAELAAEHARRAADAERDVTAALEEATTLGAQARKLTDDPAKWEVALNEALSAVKRAEGVFRGGEGADELHGRITALRQDLEAADKDRRMIALLETARMQRAEADKDGFDIKGSLALYVKAFEQDMGLAALTPEQAAEQINRRVIRDELLAALADWANMTPDKEDKKRLLNLLQKIDPDPSTFRNRINAFTNQKNREGLRLLAASPEALNQPVSRQVALARNLGGAEGVTFLRAANQRHPGDFWISFQLAYALQSLTPTPATDEAIRFYTAAIALRPASAAVHNNLGNALYSKGRLDDAVAEYHRAIELEPNYLLAHSNLGIILQTKGQTDEALSEQRKALALKPDFVRAHTSLADILRSKHQFDEALAECRIAAGLSPADAAVRYSLGVALAAKDQKEEAMAEYRKALELKPDYSLPHYAIGGLLREKGQIDEAIVEYRKAVELDPHNYLDHYYLGSALSGKGRADDALTEIRKAVELKPDYADAHNSLGNALRLKGQSDQALAECRLATELNPENAWIRNTLGLALAGKGQTDEAAAEYRKALKFDPKYYLAYYNLAGLLRAKGELDEAISQYRKVIELKPEYAEAHNDLGVALAAKGQTAEAMVEYRKAFELKPDYTLPHQNLAGLLRGKGQMEEAVVEYSKVIELSPQSPLAHYNLAACLFDKSQMDEAMTEYRKAIELKFDYADAHNGLGNALRLKRQWDEAWLECRIAVGLNPKSVWIHNTLGLVLDAKGKTDEAIAEYGKEVQLDPKSQYAYYNLAGALRTKGKLDEAISQYRKAIELKPDYFEAHHDLGVTLRDKGNLDEAIAEYRKTIELKPDLALPHSNLGWALRVQGRFTESLASFRRAQELGSKDAAGQKLAADSVRDAEDWARMDALLPILLKKEAEPSTSRVGLAFAQMCIWKKRYGDSVGFYRQCLTADPGLAEDLNSGTRYDAACAAALAGCGKDVDAKSRDEKDRPPLRKQALAWLQSDLKGWSKKAGEGKPVDLALVAEKMRHWKEDADFAGVRDKDGLSKLPPDEQDAWRKLWADVDALLKITETASPMK